MKLQKSKRIFKKIIASKVYDVASFTPLSSARLLSKKFKNNILLKREDMQPVFSFKLRGAYNKISILKEKGSLKSVVTASAGNHAQGVAFAAKKLKFKAIIVMPITTPTIKISAVKNLKDNNHSNLRRY